MIHTEWPRPFQDGYCPPGAQWLKHPTLEEMSTAANAAAVRVRARRCIRRVLGILGEIPADMLAALLRVAKAKEAYDGRR